MPRIPTVLVATALAISPIATSTFYIATNEANAFATMKSTLLMAGKTKTFPSARQVPCLQRRGCPRPHVGEQQHNKYSHKFIAQFRPMRALCGHHDEL